MNKVKDASFKMMRPRLEIPYMQSGLTLESQNQIASQNEDQLDEFLRFLLVGERQEVHVSRFDSAENDSPIGGAFRLQPVFGGRNDQSEDGSILRSDSEFQRPVGNIQEHRDIILTRFESTGGRAQNR